MIGTRDFEPPVLIRGRHLQSVLASWPPRRPFVRRRARPLLDASEDLIIDCGDGVRLLVHHTPPLMAGTGLLAILIHGWEGSASSMYILSAATKLWQAGYRVIRLNLRDHGDSHHLNEELFHSCRLPEAIGAVRRIQGKFPDERLDLIGFSLGGNFALRIAAKAPSCRINLNKVVAICPVLDPAQTLDALEHGWGAYRTYFIYKWRRSLVKKMTAFPEKYDFTDLTRFISLKGMTDYFVTGYTEYPDLYTYLRGYALTGDRLAQLEVPATMLLANDDPIVPIAGLDNVATNANLAVERSHFGGHCGFLADYRLHSWLDEYLMRVLRNVGGGAQSG